MVETILAGLALTGLGALLYWIAGRAVASVRSRAPRPFDHAPVGLFEVDAEGRLRSWNQTLVGLMGADDAATLEGVDLGSRLVGEPARARWRRWLAGDASPIEIRTAVRTEAGGSTDVILAMGQGPDEGDRAVGVLRPAAELSRSVGATDRDASLFRQIVAAAPVGIATFDREGRVGDVWNPAVEAILGWSAAELRGQPIPLLPADAARLAAGAPDGDGEAVRRWRRDGSPVDLSIVTAAIAGSPGQRVAIVQDVTERVQRELERRQLDEIIRATPDLVLIADRDGTVLYHNAAARKRLELTHSSGEEGGSTGSAASPGTAGVDAGSLSLWSSTVLGQEWERRWRNEVVPLVASGESWTGELRMGDPSFAASVVIVGHRSRDGRLGFLSMMARDISEQRSVEEQLRQSQKLEAVGQLSGGIAHDFNNLLTVVQANVELLNERPHDVEDATRLKDIESAARRGRDLVRRLMVFSRKETLSVRPYRLVELEDYVRTLRRLLPETVAVDWRCEDPDLAIQADPGAIEQVLLNLATNARDAMPEGGALTMVARSGGSHDGAEWVELAVSDTGQGMTQEVMARVFEPFFTTKPTGKGTGLGLAMCYGLVRQLDGEIKIESTPGEGTTFRLLFRRLDHVAADREAPEETGAVAGGDGELILVVEDEGAIRRVFQRSLERIGYRVLLAADGIEGVDQFLAHRSEVDLIISDVVMPRLGGPGMLAKIREEGGDVPFLFVSGYTERETRKEAKLDDSVHVLSKPWTRDELRSAVASALAGVDPRGVEAVA